VIGVLLMAYGTPGAPEDVESYYTHIRRGRPPTEEQLADLRRRYDAIGGISPLRQRTQAQADGVAAALGEGYLVALGAKHAAPFLEDGAGTLLAAGVERIVALVLAPHYSALSVGEYAERVRAAVGDRVPLEIVESWHLEEGFLDLLADRVVDALAQAPAGSEVLFTAHSLPERILAMGDPYPQQLEESAEAVSERAGFVPWSLAWQSAGRTPEPWLGPDLLEVIRAKAAEGAHGLVVCPQGFVSDHLEVLYDVDVDAQRVASEVGVTLVRTQSLNDDPRLCTTLAEVIRAR
jgi:ferrochelatase